MRGGLRHPRVKRCVCVELSRWSIPVFAGGILIFPGLFAYNRPWGVWWKHEYLVYAWFNNNGFRWRPAWVLRTCTSRCWSCCLILNCWKTPRSRSRCWSSSWTSFSGDGGFSESICSSSLVKSEPLSCSWSSVGGNSLGFLELGNSIHHLLVF